MIMDIITIKELNFKYDKELVFESLNLNIKEGSFTSIIGPYNSGKSTLAKILAGLYRYNGTIEIDGDKLNKQNKRKIRRKMGIVLSETSFLAETVMDEIVFTLENLKIKRNNINKKVKQISDILGINNILNKNPQDINSEEKQLVILASALIHEPKILILDDALTYIDPSKKEVVFNLLRDLNKKYKVTIINITNNIEESLVGEEIVLLEKGKVILQGNKKKILDHEKVFTTLKLELPFVVKLSKNLMYYELLDNVSYDMKEMVDALWK